MATILLNHKEAAVEPNAPHCQKCDRPMSISRIQTKVSDSGIQSSKNYECPRCGTKEVITGRVG